MFDTNVTIVGTALNTPEWRRTSTGAVVAHFKVASHSRRYDRGSDRWVDGDTLRVRVTCWRRLAEGVASSVLVGDPVVVTGRLYTRDWVAEDGQPRVSYELEAMAVGHDLARGHGTFTRSRGTATATVEDAESEARIAGAPAEPLAPAGAEEWPAGDAAAILREAGLDDELRLIAAQPDADDGDDDGDDDGSPVDGEPAAPEGERSGARRRGRARAVARV